VRPSAATPRHGRHADPPKAQYLLDHKTLSDRTWTTEPRLKGEKGDAFVRHILLGDGLHDGPVEGSETRTA
jgi:hypothetical protein